MVIASVSSACWVAKHVANNTLEKQLTSLEVDVITKRILEKQLVVT